MIRKQPLVGSVLAGVSALVVALAIACTQDVSRAVPIPTKASSAPTATKQSTPVQDSSPARPRQPAPDFALQVARAESDRLAYGVFSLANRAGPVVLYFSFVG